MAASFARTNFFFPQIRQEITQSLLTREQRGCLGLKAMSLDLDAHRLAFSAYLPSPPTRVLAATGGKNVVVIKTRVHA
jgi:hypothetical protein